MEWGMMWFRENMFFFGENPEKTKVLLHAIRIANNLAL